MAIYADDKLIKRKQTLGILVLRITMVVLAVLISAALIDISAATEGGYAKLVSSSLFAIIFIAAAWYVGKIMHIEYKYYMQEGVLHIDRSFMHYTCKEIFELSYKDMELVCREKSEDDLNHKKVKTIDLSSLEKQTPKVVIFYDSETYGEGRLVFEPDGEVTRSLELFLKDKVLL